MRGFRKLHDSITKWFRVPPYIINSGNCILWTALFKMLAWEHVQVYDAVDDYNQGHAFIRLGLRLYDAETPKGRTDWFRLPYFQKRTVPKEVYTVRAYIGLITILKTWAMDSDDSKNYIDKVVSEIYSSSSPTKCR